MPIVEQSVIGDEELLRVASRKKYRPVFNKFEDIPAGSHIICCAVKTAVNLDATQLASLKTQIEAISGVQNCVLLMKTDANGTPAEQVGYNVNATFEMSFEYVEEPV